MNGESSRYDKLENMLQDGCSKPHNIPLKYLRNITNNFSEERLLGEGGFGTVYKGVLQNGKTIAVKKLNSSIPRVKDKQFENEANHLMRLKHRNVVLLVGWCYETSEKTYAEYNGKYVWAEKLERLLCLEYMPKGDLRRYLSDPFCGLGWDTRYKIIEGICYGLHYLHEQWQPNAPIVHMDLKPANILLDNNMMPKITDFGLSRLFSEEKTSTRTRHCDGTLGYMSPEYINKGLISTKSDIFSLGVIIIEVVTGLRDYPDETGTSSDEFIETVLNNWTRRRVEIFFGVVSPEVDYQQIRRCIQIGLDCVKFDRNKRPTIRQIIKTLHGPGNADSNNIKWGIPEQMDAPVLPPSSQPANTVQAAQQAHAAVISSRPNANPLDLFPQSLPNASAIPEEDNCRRTTDVLARRCNPMLVRRSSANWDQTSPSALHSAASGGTSGGDSAFGQWQKPSPLAAQSYDLSYYKLLMERLFKAVGRQEEALSAICPSIVQCRSMERRRGANKKNDIWFSFYGPDSVAKRRVGVALAELMHGSSENLIYLDLSHHDWGNPNFRGKRATDCISEELRRKRRSVIFLDNVDQADCLVQESLNHAMETGRYKDLHGGRVVDLNDSIVVLSTKMIQGCQDATRGIKDGNVFSEEKVVAARGNQLKIIVEQGTANISGGPGGKFVVSSRHSLRNSQASLYSISFSKRKLHISDGQEKTAESPSTSKRVHRTSSVPFDLNLPGDEAEAHDGDEDSSSSHENSSGDPEGSVGNLLRSVDESINFKPFDFDKLCEDILQEFSNTIISTLGSMCRLEIDTGAMVQVLAAAWASNSDERRTVRMWVEQVFAKSIEQLKVRCKNLSSFTLRLVACEDEMPVKEDGFGALLPSRIILDW